MKDSTKTIVVGIVASVAAILIAQYFIKIFNLSKLKQQQMGYEYRPPGNE